MNFCKGVRDLNIANDKYDMFYIILSNGIYYAQGML